jgi:hypothetical protein
VTADGYDSNCKPILRPALDADAVRMPNPSNA